MIKQNVYLLPENVNPLGNLNVAFTFLFIFIPVKSSFKSWFQLCDSFALLCVDEVAFVIANVGTWFATVPAAIKQFADQISIRLFSQLINEISQTL